MDDAVKSVVEAIKRGISVQNGYKKEQYDEVDALVVHGSNNVYLPTKEQITYLIEKTEDEKLYELFVSLEKLYDNQRLEYKDFVEANKHRNPNILLTLKNVSDIIKIATADDLVKVDTNLSLSATPAVLNFINQYKNPKETILKDKLPEDVLSNIDDLQQLATNALNEKGSNSINNPGILLNLPINKDNFDFYMKHLGFLVGDVNSIVKMREIGAGLDEEVVKKLDDLTYRTVRNLMFKANSYDGRLAFIDAVQKLDYFDKSIYKTLMESNDGLSVLIDKMEKASDLEKHEFISMFLKTQVHTYDPKLIGRIGESIADKFESELLARRILDNTNSLSYQPEFVREFVKRLTHEEQLNLYLRCSDVHNNYQLFDANKKNVLKDYVSILLTDGVRFLDNIKFSSWKIEKFDIAKWVLRSDAEHLCNKYPELYRSLDYGEQLDFLRRNIVTGSVSFKDYNTFLEFEAEFPHVYQSGAIFIDKMEAINVHVDKLYSQRSDVDDKDYEILMNLIKFVDDSNRDKVADYLYYDIDGLVKYMQNNKDAQRLFLEFEPELEKEFKTHELELDQKVNQTNKRKP